VVILGATSRYRITMPTLLKNEIDPSISDGEPVTAVAWTITGGTGYDTTSGEGDNDIPYADGGSFFLNGTGTITTD